MQFSFPLIKFWTFKFFFTIKKESIFWIFHMRVYGSVLSGYRACRSASVAESRSHTNVPANGIALLTYTSLPDKHARSDISQYLIVFNDGSRLFSSPSLFVLRALCTSFVFLFFHTIYFFVVSKSAICWNISSFNTLSLSNAKFAYLHYMVKKSS